MKISLLVVCRRKVALHTSSHLTPTEAWRSTVSTTWEGHKASTEVRFENCMQVWGWAKLGNHATHCWEKIILHPGSDLSKPVQTCQNLSTIQWSCTVVVQLFFCTFESPYSLVFGPIQLELHILTRLMVNFPMVYGLWRCIEVKLSDPLGARA